MGPFDEAQGRSFASLKMTRQRAWAVWKLLERYEVRFPGAGSAQYLSFAPYFSAEVDSLAACLTHHSFAFVSWEFFRRQIDFYPLRDEKIVVGNFAVGQHLLLVLVGDLGMHLAS